MICIKGELAQAEHKIDDDKAYTDLHDDKKEVVTLGQHTGNDHYTRETADEVQPDDHKDLVEESWQPIRELVSDIKTDTDMICIKDELAQAEHEVNDDEVYTDLRDDKKEVATVDQYTGNDNYTGEAADEIQPNDCEQLTEESWQPVKKLASNIETGTDKKSIESKLVHTEHEETYSEAPVNDDKVYTDLRNDRDEVETSNQ